LTQSKHVPINVVPINVVRPVHTVIPNLKVTRPRHDKPIVTKPNSPTRRHINSSPYPKASNSPPRVNVVQAPMVNAAQGSGPTWLFDIDTLTKTMSYQPVTVGNQSNPSAGVQEQLDAEKAREEIEQQYVLFPVWSSGSTNPQNNDRDAAFDKKEPEFDENKLESEVNVSLSKFEDFFDNIINKVTATVTLVPTVGQISPNNNNTFSVAAPLNVAASPTHGKSSCIDASQLLDDPDMPELEYITYSNDEDDVGAEADFNNLETSITVSPIPTTRVHKEHHVTQINGDLSLAT
nr:hypothetical protein [Tanacetum cinerariifolium]